MRYKKVNRKRWVIVRRYPHGAEQIIRVGFYATRSFLIEQYIASPDVSPGLTWRQVKRKYNVRCVRATLVWSWS